MGKKTFEMKGCQKILKIPWTQREKHWICFKGTVERSVIINMHLKARDSRNASKWAEEDSVGKVEWEKKDRQADQSCYMDKILKITGLAIHELLNWIYNRNKLPRLESCLN